MGVVGRGRERVLAPGSARSARPARRRWCGRRSSWRCGTRSPSAPARRSSGTRSASISRLASISVSTENSSKTTITTGADACTSSRTGTSSSLANRSETGETTRNSDQEQRRDRGPARQRRSARPPRARRGSAAPTPPASASGGQRHPGPTISPLKICISSAAVSAADEDEVDELAEPRPRATGQARRQQQRRRDQDQAEGEQDDVAGCVPARDEELGGVREHVEEWLRDRERPEDGQVHPRERGPRCGAIGVLQALHLPRGGPPLALDLGPRPAAGKVVVHDPARLHGRVGGGRPHEAEAAPLELLGQRGRLGRERGEVGQRARRPAPAASGRATRPARPAARRARPPPWRWRSPPRSCRGGARCRRPPAAA